MSTTRLAITVASLALIVSRRIRASWLSDWWRGTWNRIGLPTPPLFRGRESPDTAERWILCLGRGA